MVASVEWSQRATEVFVETVGTEKTRELITKLQRIPAANASVKQTLARLDETLKYLERS